MVAEEADIPKADGIFLGPAVEIDRMRDPRFTAPHRFEIEHGPGGEKRITNLTDFATGFDTMTAALDHWAHVASDRIWLAERSGEGWHCLAFGEAGERVRILAGGLRDLAINARGPLLLLSANTIDHALISYAMMSLGRTVAPVSPQYGPSGADPARLHHACEALRPSAVYTEDAESFSAGLNAPCLAGLPVIASRNARAGDIPIETLYRSAPAPAAARPSDPARYLLTSGSTGRPKAVVCTHRMIALNTAQAAACFADPEPPVIVNCAPWSHSMGAHSVLHMSVHRGATFYIDRGQPTAARFGETIRNLGEIGPTFHNMVPAGLMLLAGELAKDDRLARRFFERLRLIQNGGVALGQEIADHFEQIAMRAIGERVSFSSGYGATETGPTICNVHWPNLRMGMLGLPIPGTSIRLVPVDGKLEVRVSGPQVFEAYVGRPDLNATAFDETGYYRLGDAARPLDRDSANSPLVYDGRLSENFKLASATFVGVGELRVRALSAIGPAVTDAIVCGEGEEMIGLLLYPNPACERDDIEAAARIGLAALNAKARGQGERIGCAMVMADPPDPQRGEITDKGYIAQSVARSIHATEVEQLFATPSGPAILDLRHVVSPRP